MGRVDSAQYSIAFFSFGHFLILVSLRFLLSLLLRSLLINRGGGGVVNKLWQPCAYSHSVLQGARMAYFC
jgi:hypothetical protein